MHVLAWYVCPKQLKIWINIILPSQQNENWWNHSNFHNTLFFNILFFGEWRTTLLRKIYGKNIDASAQIQEPTYHSSFITFCSGLCLPVKTAPSSIQFLHNTSTGNVLVEGSRTAGNEKCNKVSFHEWATQN